MEPRLHALRDMSNQSSMPSNTEASNVISSGSQRPQPPDHSFVRPKSLMLANTSPENAQFSDVRRDVQERSYPTRSMPSAPIAQVLNNEANVLGAAQPVPSTFASSTTPFSGRLVDLLLDSPDHARQKWDQEQQFVQPENSGCSPSVIKLPRLPQPPKRTAKRPRIPPLLQGLHQPPPLPPEGRLFPPITGEKNAFAGERGYDARFEESRSKDVDEHAFLEGSAVDYSRTAQNSDHPLVAQPVAQSSAPDVANETNVAVNNARRTRTPTEVKRGRKRNKWSQQETKDLLVGVSRYGIGSWKKILQDPDFVFYDRTAVDLKDRFRVCFPSEGLKPQKPRTKGKEKASLDNTALDLPNQAMYTHQHSLPLVEHNNDNSLVSKSSSPTETQERVATRNKTATQLDLAELGIHEPFAKATRRPRRTFSARDDANLLKGFEKYGSVWHLIRDDEDLGFGSRHHTDLRDRFRTRYPEKYAKAGYKLKKDKERTLSEQALVQEQDRQDGPSQLEQTILDHNPPQHTKTSHPQQDMTTAAKDIHPLHNISNTTTPSHFVPSTTTSNPNSALKPFTSSSYLSDPLPTLPFDDTDPDLTPDMATAGDESPITLSRNILRWADANPSSLYAFAPAVSSSSALTTGGNVHGGGHGGKGEGGVSAGAGAGVNGYTGGVGGQQQQQQGDGGRGAVLPEADSWLLGGERVQAFGMYRYRS